MATTMPKPTVNRAARFFWGRAFAWLFEKTGKLPQLRALARALQIKEATLAFWITRGEPRLPPFHRTYVAIADKIGLSAEDRAYIDSLTRV